MKKEKKFACVVLYKGIVEKIISFDTREQAEEKAIEETKEFTEARFESYDDLLEYQDKNLGGLEGAEVFVQEIEHFSNDLNCECGRKGEVRLYGKVWCRDCTIHVI